MSGHQRVVPKNVLNNIRKLLKVYDNGIKASEFCEIYEDEFDRRLNYTALGFKHVVDLLDECSDVLDLEEVLFVYPRLQRKESMMSRDRSPVRERNVPNAVRKNIANLVKRFRYGIDAGQLNNAYKKEYGRSLDIQDFGFKKMKSFLKDCDDVVILEQRNNNMYVMISQEPQANAKGKRVPDSIQKNLATMMLDHKNGLKLDYVRMTYEEQFDKQLNHSSFGYKVLEDFLRECDVVTIEQRNSGLWVIPAGSARRRQDSERGSNRRRQDSERGSFADSKQKRGSSTSSQQSTPKFVLSNLRSLLEKHRDGVRVDDIRLLYEDEFGYPLDHLSLGYKKLRAFLLSCNDVLDIKENKGVQYVYLHEGGRDSSDHETSRPRRNSNRRKRGNSKSQKHVDLIGMDCEMVGVKVGVRKQAVARCSVVDQDGKVLFDEYIKPDELITDYRTKWNGIKPRDMDNAIPFDQARDEIMQILHKKITIVGHNLEHDFETLHIPIGPYTIRDTAHCVGLRKMGGLPFNQTPTLMKLADRVLKEKIQQGSHDTLEDARTALQLYKECENDWQEIPDAVRQNLLKLSKKHVEGIKVDAIYQAYKKEYGTAIGYTKHGFKELKDLLTECADVVQVRQEKKSFVMYPKGKNKNRTRRDSRKSDKMKEPEVPEDIRRNLGALMKKHPEGVKQAQLVNLYKKEFNSQLDYFNHGFDKLKDFLEQCWDVVTLKQNEDGGNQVFPVLETAENFMEMARRSTKTGDELSLTADDVTDDVTKKMEEMTVDGNNSSFVVVES